MSIHDKLNQLSPVVERETGDENKRAVCGAVSVLMRDERGEDVSEERLIKRAVSLCWMVSPEVFGGRRLAEVLKDLQ